MKKTCIAAVSALLLIASGCDFEAANGSSTDVDSILAARSDTAAPAAAAEPVAQKTAAKPTSTPAASPAAAVAPVAAPVAAPAPAAVPQNIGGALYYMTPTSLTLRADFAAVTGGIDAVANNSHGNGNKAHIPIPATRSGNTWTIPQALSSYKTGSIPNTWRIRLNSTPPAGVTYHTSIMQTFIRVGEAPGKTYPPTTRR